MKTFNLAEVEILVSKAMNIESPLGQKIMHQFNDAPIALQAKDIVDNMNEKRYCASGFVHGIKDELALEVDHLLNNQIEKQFQVEELNHREMELDSNSFQAGYRIGMGAVPLSRLL